MKGNGTAEALFVAGTDTEVGKTAISGGLAGALKRRGVDVGVVKPVQTGCIEEEGVKVAPDARFLRQSAGIDDGVCPFKLEPALAPRVAAEIVGKELRYDEILHEVSELVDRHDFTVVEGIGGVRVPLAEDKEVIDMMTDFGFPVVVVARSGLGTLNHTALTIEALRRRGLDVLGVVLNRYPGSPDQAEETNPREIERLVGVEVLGKVPELCLDTEEGQLGGIIESVDESLDLRVFEELIP